MEYEEMTFHNFIQKGLDKRIIKPFLNLSLEGASMPARLMLPGS